ncbi:MAG: hypothetical protein Q4C42_00930 [Clostridia bacterium]|nr:hypothetical protein [Clostridia bacterium]
MKKIIAIIMALALMLGALAGCNSGKTSVDKNGESQAQAQVYYGAPASNRIKKLLLGKKRR